MIKLSIAILCGGKSSRFGKDKSLFEYGGKKLYRYAYDTLSPLTDDIFVQCGKKSESLYDVATNNDDYLDMGPIGGIYSALKRAKYDRTLVVGCDMPYITERFARYLASSKGDIIVPKWNNGYYEPLCAIYSSALKPVLEYNIVSGDLRISSLFSKIKLKEIKIESLIEQGIINDSMFKNINRPQDVD